MWPKNIQVSSVLWPAVSATEAIASTPTANAKPEGDKLIVQIGSVLAHAPDPVQRDFQRKKHARGTDQQHDDGVDLHALVRMRKLLHVAHDEVRIWSGPKAEMSTSSRRPLAPSTASERPAREIVSIITMNGKSDRITLAATLNA